MPESEDREAYAGGVERLVSGDTAEAIRLLEPVCRDGSRFEARLALGKARLSRGEAAAAGDVFAEMLSGTRSVGAKLRAYVLLLSARAAADRGLGEDAARLAAEAVRSDPRLEPAARRIREGAAGTGV